jgi:hypothetical protein
MAGVSANYGLATGVLADDLIEPQHHNRVADTVDRVLGLFLKRMMAAGVYEGWSLTLDGEVTAGEGLVGRVQGQRGVVDPPLGVAEQVGHRPGVHPIAVRRHLAPRRVDIPHEAQVGVVRHGQFVLELKLVKVVAEVVGPILGNRRLTAQAEELAMAADRADIVLLGRRGRGAVLNLRFR